MSKTARVYLYSFLFYILIIIAGIGIWIISFIGVQQRGIISVRDAVEYSLDEDVAPMGVFKTMWHNILRNAQK